MWMTRSLYDCDKKARLLIELSTMVGTICCLLKVTALNRQELSLVERRCLDIPSLHNVTLP